MKYGTSQKHQWPTIYLLAWSPIDLLWVKCSTVGIPCRNIWEKKTESNNTKNTKIKNINFTRWKANPPVRVGVAVSASGTCFRACLHSAHPRDATKDRAARGCPIPMRPLIAINRCVVVLLCCCVVVLLCCCVKSGEQNEGTSNKPTHAIFPAKMNSSFSQTTPKRQLQCHCQMSPTKQQGEIQWEVPIRLIRVCSTKYLLSRCHKVRYFTSYYIKPEFKGEVWLCGWSAVFHW